jgi:hypothetical protein
MCSERLRGGGEWGSGNAWQTPQGSRAAGFSQLCLLLTAAARLAALISMARCAAAFLPALQVRRPQAVQREAGRRVCRPLPERVLPALPASRPGAAGRAGTGRRLAPRTATHSHVLGGGWEERAAFVSAHPIRLLSLPSCEFPAPSDVWQSPSCQPGPALHVPPVEPHPSLLAHTR